MYKEILVPLDGSELAEKALPHAEDLARRLDARLTLFSVVESIVVYSQPGVVGPIVSVTFNIEEEIEKIREYLRNIAENFTQAGIDARVEVRQGDAASQICDFAQETGVDLIVMSTHGRSGLRRWVYGSVADRVLRGASVPVLLVRAVGSEGEPL